MSERTKGPEEQKSTPARSEVVAEHRQGLEGVAHEAEEQGKIVSPEEVYSRNLEQTAQDVETALGLFDAAALRQDYIHHVEVGRRYWDEGDTREKPKFDYDSSQLLNYEHTQSFDVNGKRIDVTLKFSQANDDYIVDYEIIITVRGKRYTFTFNARTHQSNVYELASFQATSSINASGKEKEVRSYKKGQRFQECRSQDGSSFPEGPFEEGTHLKPREEEMAKLMKKLIENLGGTIEAVAYRRKQNP